MDNSHCQHESVYLEQQPHLASFSTEANNTIPHTGNTTYLLTAKIKRMKLKTDLVRFSMENKVGSHIYFFVLKVLYLFIILLVTN